MKDTRNTVRSTKQEAPIRPVRPTFILHPSSFILYPSSFFLLCVFLAAPASAMDQVTLRRDGKTLEVTGRLLVKAQDGGLLMLARDGTIWAITPDEQVGAHERRPGLRAL